MIIKMMAMRIKQPPIDNGRINSKFAFVHSSLSVDGEYPLTQTAHPVPEHSAQFSSNNKHGLHVLFVLYLYIEYKK